LVQLLMEVKMIDRDKSTDDPCAFRSRRRFLAITSMSAASCTVAGGLFAPRSAGAAGPTRQRPLSDFLSTQGTFCSDDGQGGCTIFVPPAPNFLGWNTRPDESGHVLFSGVDYAGLANAFFQNAFGTVVDGMVTERPLPDGRAQVRVALMTRNANTWVIDLDLNGDILGQIAAKPTLFGQRPGAGGGYALGSAKLDAVFVNTAPDASLPDLLQLLNAPTPGQAFEFLAFNGEATGPLTAQFGVVEGTLGRCNQRQSGLFASALRANENSRVALDAYPAEFIVLHRIGK
jgi:hypothetical protein